MSLLFLRQLSSQPMRIVKLTIKYSTHIALCSTGLSNTSGTDRVKMAISTPPTAVAGWAVVQMTSVRPQLWMAASLPWPSRNFRAVATWLCCACGLTLSEDDGSDLATSLFTEPSATCSICHSMITTSYLQAAHSLGHCAFCDVYWADLVTARERQMTTGRRAE